MSEFTVVEYEPFPIEEDTPPPLRRRRTPPWRWGVLGLAIGLVLGMALTFEPPDQTPVDAGPLRVSGPIPAATTADLGLPEPSETLARAVDGFVGDIHVFLETTGGTAHARVLSQRPGVLVIEDHVDPTSRPDRRGTSLARIVELADGAHLEVSSSLALGDGTTIWLGSDVTGWAWSRERGGAIAWSEATSDDNATRVGHQDLGGPPKEDHTVGGSWTLVDYAGDSAVLVSDDAIGLLDLELGQFYVRTGAAPASVAGIYDRTVLGSSGPDRNSVQIDLRGTYRAAPDWWQPAAGELLTDPGTGWAVQSYGDTVALISPDGAVEHLVASALPAWSANRLHLVVPVGSMLLFVDLRDGSRATLDLGAPIQRVWVSG